MKTKMLLLLVMVISTCGSIAGQTSAELQQVTLYYYSHQHPTGFRSYVNFETGKRGPLRGELPADFDLRYGGVIIGKGDKALPDWLTVADSRSMIVELGAKTWQDIKETPPFPPPSKSRPPLPLANRPIVVDASAGSKEISPYRQLIIVKPGHMYLMRLMHGKKVIYTMFRVESLNSRESCVLSWKMVKPPNVDDNEK
jgi:hypothetical protein